MGNQHPVSPLWFSGPSLWSGILSPSGVLLADTGLSHRGGSPPPPASSCPRPLRTSTHPPTQGPCQTPGLCSPCPQGDPPRELPPATLTCLWAPATSLVPGASSLADPHPALQDRPLPSGLRPPHARPAVIVPSPGVQSPVAHNLSSPERATMQTPEKGLMTPSCRPAPLSPRLDLWGVPWGPGLVLTVLPDCTAHLQVPTDSTRSHLSLQHSLDGDVQAAA